MNRPDHKWVAVVLLILATTIAYLPVKDSEFIDLDDDVYVTDNPWIQQGLNRQSALLHNSNHLADFGLCM